MVIINTLILSPLLQLHVKEIITQIKENKLKILKIN